MTDELVRAVIAVPIATLLPLVKRRPPRRLVRIGVATGVMLAALAPYLDGWHAWVSVAAAALAAGIPRAPSFNRPTTPLFLTAAAVAIAAVTTDADAAWRAIETVGNSRDVAVVTGGALMAVFLAGAAIGRLLHPFAELVRGTEDTPGMESAGRYIGWLERALLYGLIVLGSADAAALVVAAKSIARFPSFSEEKFAEYYLIGTLLSLLIAAAAGFGVRAAIGLDALP
jgi:hypothetical protein